jgi:phytoene dehydrogenase-like protein
MNYPRVAIVGAGPAGLSAARWLSRRGIDVQVYEKLPSPGGRSGCDALEGYRFDRGAEFVTSFYPRTLRMIRAHDLAEQLLPVHLEGDILLAGQFSLRRSLLQAITLAARVWKVRSAPVRKQRNERSAGCADDSWR